MKKYFVVADVHSFYDEMVKALSEKGYDRDHPDHVLVSLGETHLEMTESYPGGLLAFLQEVEKRKVTAAK